MSETTTAPETVTVELNVEVAYQQLVGFQKAVVAYNKADEEDSDKGRLEAANDAVNASLLLINDVVPADMRAKLRTGTLQFCRHHGNEYGPALAGLGAKIEEFTEGLKVLGAPMDVSPG